MSVCGDIGHRSSCPNNNYYFGNFVSKFIGRFDWVNNTASQFATISGSPVDMLIASDGALYMLTRNGITRFSGK